MDAKAIRRRCRKFSLRVTDNAIFGDAEAPYDFTPTFRTTELALANLKSLQAMSLHGYDETRIYEFYLVPAQWVDAAG